MAKGKKTGGKDFTKGDLRAGRPRTSDEHKLLRKLTRAEMEATLNRYILLPIDKLQSVIEDRTLPVLDHWVCRILLMGIKEGDDKRLTFMFDRLIGKVKDNIEHTFIKPTIIERLDGSTVELGTEIKEIE